MDPFTLGLLALIAFGYATRNAWKALGKSYSANHNKGGSELAFWLKELAGGFPSARHPFMDTWHSHGAATRQMREARLAARPGQIVDKRNLKDTIAEHKRRIADARAAQAPVTSTAQTDPPIPGLPASTVGQPAGGRRHRNQPAVTQPAPAQHPGGQPAAGAPPLQNGHDPMACKDPACVCHQNQASAPG